MRSFSVQHELRAVQRRGRISGAGSTVLHGSEHRRAAGKKRNGRPFPRPQPLSLDGAVHELRPVPYRGRFLRLSLRQACLYRHRSVAVLHHCRLWRAASDLLPGKEGLGAAGRTSVQSGAESLFLHCLRPPGSVAHSGHFAERAGLCGSSAPQPHGGPLSGQAAFRLRPVLHSDEHPCGMLRGAGWNP